MKGFMIAGVRSGCGKTTVTCAVLAAFRARGIKAASFKCGPDYIDPMFHRVMTGAPAYNLDSFFCGEDTIRYLLDRGSSGCDISVAEGVMGFYDGAEGSAHSVSQITGMPVVLVIDCKGMSDSIGAVMSGFLSYRRPNNIAGFIFDRLPERLAPLAERLCGELGTGYFGFMPQTTVTLESRHLGLVTAAEVEGIGKKLSALGALAEKHILLDRLLGLEVRLPGFAAPQIPKIGCSPVIAVARDRAFCFIYEESISLLEEMGCTVIYFSPLEDSAAPDADGLILCGGYPELYADRLSANRPMLDDIRYRISSGMPVIAECGGFMYLHERLTTDSGESFEMAGLIKGDAYPAGRLGRFGYVTMTAMQDCLVCEKGGSLKSHEFHYFDSSSCGEGFTAVKSDGRQWQCAHTSESMYAGFPHLYLWSDIGAAERFARACAVYGGKDEQDS